MGPSWRGAIARQRARRRAVACTRYLEVKFITSRTASSRERAAPSRKIACETRTMTQGVAGKQPLDAKQPDGQVSTSADGVLAGDTR